MASIGELAQDIVREADLDAALHKLCDATKALCRATSVILATMNDEQGVLDLMYGSDFAAIGGKLEVDIGAGFGIIAYVAATSETVQSGNVRELEQYKLRYESTVSEIALPVLDRYGRVRAVLNLESDQPNAFNPDDLSTCQAMAALASALFERREGERRAEALTQLGRAMETVMVEGDLIQRVLRVSEKVMGYQACSLFLLDSVSGKFVLQGSISSLQEKIGVISYAAGEGCTGWVCENGKSILLNEPQSDPRWRGRYVEFPSEEIASFLAVPILSRGRCIGCIRLLRRKPNNRYLNVRYTEDDQRVMEAMAEQFAVGLENIRNLERVVRSERMVAWGELSAKSSHMIGNRVFALKGDVNEFGYQMRHANPEPQVLKELQESLATNVVRLEELLQEFRDFLTATKLNLEQEDVNLVIQETCKEVFPKRSGELTLKLASGLPMIYVDRSKMRRALAELLENALQHDESGKVEVSSWVEEGGSWVCVAVSDHGPGVPSDRKAQIFTPFFSGRVKGMGLGLSIVQGIVEAHGGHIQEVGQVGEGAKFVILLPIPDRP